MFTFLTGSSEGNNNNNNENKEGNENNGNNENIEDAIHTEDSINGQTYEKKDDKNGSSDDNESDEDNSDNGTSDEQTDGDISGILDDNGKEKGKEKESNVKKTKKRSRNTFEEASPQDSDDCDEVMGQSEGPNRKKKCNNKGMSINVFSRIWNGQLLVLEKNPSIQDCNTLLYGTTMVKVTYDRNMNDRIIFMLPNLNMHNNGFISPQQQIEINKVLRKIANGKDMTWKLNGIKNALDIIRKMKNYIPINDRSIFNVMKADIHFRHIDIMENEIIFELNWREMNDLHPKWHLCLYQELCENSIFSEMESVIINKKFENVKEKEEYVKEKRDKKSRHKEKEHEQIFIIRKIPTTITTTCAKMEQNAEIEKLLKELLNEYDIIPSQQIKKIIFMRSKPRNSKIDVSRINHNAKLIIRGNFDMTDIVGKEYDMLIGKIKIDKFLTPMDKQFHKSHPLIAVMERCYQCNCLNHPRSGKNGCKYRKEHIKKEIKRLIESGIQDRSEEMKKALRVFKPPTICRKCSSLVDSHFERDCKNKMKCLNCGKEGDHRTIDYELCERAHFNASKITEFCILKYGEKYTIDMIKKDYPRGINIKVAINGIEYYKAKQMGKEKEYNENKRKEKKMHQQDKIIKKMYDFSKSMVEYMAKENKKTDWPDLMETLNTELDLENIPNQERIENEIENKENNSDDVNDEKQEEKDTIVQTHGMAQQEIRNNENSNSNGSNNVSIFEQNKKEMNMTEKTLEMIKGIKSKIYSDFKKENNIGNEIKIGDNAGNRRKDNAKRINKYDMYDKLNNFNIDELDLEVIHGYKSIDERNKGDENIPSLKIGNKRYKASKLQRRVKSDGSVVASGSDDYNKNEMGSMENVNGKRQQL